jgi:hypothetical protein
MKLIGSLFITFFTLIALGALNKWVSHGSLCDYTFSVAALALARSFYAGLKDE